MAGPWSVDHDEDGHGMTKKVIELFGDCGGAGRSVRVRNTAESTGRATGGVYGREQEETGCSEDKAVALARMVLDHREGLGLSQREFAKESGISRTILSKVEQGELYPGGKVRRKLAAAMDLTPMDLWWIGPDAGHRQENSRNGFSGQGRQARHAQHREAS
jgi:ribosome-binding protein aMBF1 (putative translation factor)